MDHIFSRMQSLWFGVLSLIIVGTLCSGAPADVAGTSDVIGPQARIIIPPELPSHFELLKEKSDKDNNDTTSDSDSTPLAFLRTSQDDIKKSTSMNQLPAIALEGNKQTPIYITIPVFINSGYPAPPTIGVDNGAVFTSPVLEQLHNVVERRAITGEDLKYALAELLRDSYRQRSKKKNSRNKNRVNRFKPFNMY